MSLLAFKAGFHRHRSTSIDISKWENQNISIRAYTDPVLTIFLDTSFP